MIRYLVPYEREYIKRARYGVYLPIVVLISKPVEELSIPKLVLRKRNGKDEYLYDRFLEYVQEPGVVVDKLAFLIEEVVHYPTIEKIMSIELFCFRSLYTEEKLDIERLWEKFKSCLLELEFIETILTSNSNISVGIFSEETCKALSKNLYTHQNKSSLSSVDVENHRRWRVENHEYLRYKDL